MNVVGIFHIKINGYEFINQVSSLIEIEKEIVRLGLNNDLDDSYRTYIKCSYIERNTRYLHFEVGY